MKHLLIGGMGLVGQYIGRVLSENNHEILIVDNFSSSKTMSNQKYLLYNQIKNDLEKYPGIQIIELDVKDTKNLMQIISSYKPDIVHYLAALLASESEKNPEEAKKVILESVKETISYLENNKKPYKFIYASSSYVYGDFVTTVADENHPISPLDVYGKNKALAEKFIVEYDWKFGKWVIIRPSSVYGIGDPRERYATTCIEQAYYKNVVHLYYPEFIGDFTYVKDVAQAFYLSSIKPVYNEIFNITYGEAHTNKTFISALQKYIPDSNVLIHDDKLLNAPTRGALDSMKARKMLGWQPLYSIDYGIKDALKTLDEITVAMISMEAK